MIPYLVGQQRELVRMQPLAGTARSAVANKGKVTHFLYVLSQAVLLHFIDSYLGLKLDKKPRTLNVVTHRSVLEFRVKLLNVLSTCCKKGRHIYYDSYTIFVSLYGFLRVRKIAKSDYSLRHVCPSARMEQLGSHWKDFHGI
jgi:hypothetical protein